MSPDPFDELDRELARGLSQLAPEVGGADETLASMRPRFHRARTRARIVRVSAGLASLLAVGTIATLAAPSSTRSHVSVNAPGSTPTTAHRRVPSSTRHTSTTTVPSTRATTTTSTVAPNSSGPGPSNSSGPGSGPSTVTTPTPVPVTTPDGHGGPGPSGGGNGGNGGHGHGGSSTTTTVPSESSLHTYGSSGGSITVRFAHGELSLAHVSPASGCTADVRDRGPQHVEVRFMRGGQERSRIVLQVENGRVVRTDHSNG